MWEFGECANARFRSNPLSSSIAVRLLMGGTFMSAGPYRTKKRTTGKATWAAQKDTEASTLAYAWMQSTQQIKTQDD